MLVDLVETTAADGLRLDGLWGPNRTERSQLATLKKELGL